MLEFIFYLDLEAPSFEILSGLNSAALFFHRLTESDF